MSVEIVADRGSSLVALAMPTVIFMTLVLVASALFHFWMTSRRYVQLGNKIPGPKAYPFIGNANMLLGMNHNEIMERAMQLSYIYGNVARGWLGYHLVVFLTEPADIEIILNSYVHLTKSSEYRFFKPWLGDGLLISSGKNGDRIEN